MLNRRPFRSQEPQTGEHERIRIRARLDALERDGESDSTRPFILPGTDALFSPTAGAESMPPESGTKVETRAYFMTDDGGVLAEIPCDEQAGIITIGRGNTAEIRVNDPYVHRLQAEIRWDERQRMHVLSHGGGENATYVNQRAIQQPCRLQGGERLRFGKTNLVYRIRR